MTLHPTDIPALTARDAAPTQSQSETAPAEFLERRWPLDNFFESTHPEPSLRRAELFMAMVRLGALRDLPTIRDWEVDHGTRPGMCWVDAPWGEIRGHLLHDRDWDAPRRRKALHAWANVIGGQIHEAVNTDSVLVVAWTVIDQVLVTIANYLFPDGTCVDCGGPAVEGRILRHTDTCPQQVASVEPTGGAQ
jgi:hypothetical protein